jgi:hypothetical protein
MFINFHKLGYLTTKKKNLNLTTDDLVRYGSNDGLVLHVESASGRPDRQDPINFDRKSWRKRCGNGRRHRAQSGNVKTG